LELATPFPKDLLVAMLRFFLPVDEQCMDMTSLGCQPRDQTVSSSYRMKKTRLLDGSLPMALRKEFIVTVSRQHAPEKALVASYVQHSPDEAVMIDYDGQCSDRSALRRRPKTLVNTSCVLP